ncbi:MAG: membrane dipeptidase [Deltaproteobacteria bacterium]|nr:membrane dipeptidase [Deltaproteobacteria bacterium]
MQIDLHADTPLLLRWAGYRFTRRHRAYLPAGAFFSHVDLPRMEAAGLDAQLFGLVALPIEPDPFASVNAMIDRVEAAAAESRGGFRLVRSAGEVRAARAAGARAGLLSIEGVHPLRGDLSRVDALAARGVISFGLAHFHANEACRPARGLGRHDASGLTDFGRELVAHLGARHLLVDLTHVNRAGYFEALARAPGPVFVSHTGACGAHPHWRNLDDEQIRALAERGGIAGVIFARGFLGGKDLSAVVRHVQHLIKVGGESIAALGSDFDGFVVPVRGLRDVTGLPALREALARAALSPRVIDGVMGDNALRFLEHALGGQP